MKKAILIISIACWMLASCGDDTPQQLVNPRLDDVAITIDVPARNAFEAAVKANCYQVLKAVKAFAAANSGVYPSDTNADTTPQGDTVIDLLGGTLLANPYTKVNSEPLNGTAVRQGETGYVPVSSESSNDGFVITGFGDTQVILELTSP